MNEKLAHICYPAIGAFNFSIKYNETDRRTHFREIDLHVHKECEIYVNLSGDVSFFVENKLYPLRRGDVIVAMPGEYHHCVYHSDARHALYWILFDASGNETLLAPLVAHLGQYGNRISPSEQDRERLIALCERLLQTSPSAIEGYASFFELLSLIMNADHQTEHTEMEIPSDLNTSTNICPSH